MAIPGSCFSDAHKLAHTSDVWCSHIFLCFFFFSFYSSPCPSIGGPYRLLRAFGSFFLSLPIVVLTTLDLKWLFPCWKMETPFFHSFCLFSRIDTFPVLVLPQGYSEVPEFGFQADKWRHKEPWKMQEQQEKKGSWRYIWGYLVRRDTRLGGLLNTFLAVIKPGSWDTLQIAQAIMFIAGELDKTTFKVPFQINSMILCLYDFSWPLCFCWCLICLERVLPAPIPSMSECICWVILALCTSHVFKGSA